MKIVLWNLLLASIGLAVILSVGKMYPKIAALFTDSEHPPFTDTQISMQFVPKVGYLYKPNTEMRYTNGLDFWTVSQSNSLDFPDREPISAQQAADSCHITILGDSFLCALEVPLSDRIQVQLENIAARDLPNQDITTSAFGISGTGQINQLALYDEYARFLNPKVVVLLFARNDFADNHKILKTLTTGWGPERMPYFYAKKNIDDTINLLPPDPDPEWEVLRKIQTLRESESNDPVIRQLETSISESESNHGYGVKAPIRAEMLLYLYPNLRSAFGSWRPTSNVYSIELSDQFLIENPVPVFQDAKDFTAFAIDEFKKRADRDGSSLIILLEQEADYFLPILKPMAETRQIPIVSISDYMNRIGADQEDAHWKHDGHWNPAGHRWAAETLIEYLKQNTNICRRG